MGITAQGFTRPTLAQIQADFLSTFNTVFTYIDPATNIEYKPSLEPEDFLGALALIMADQFDKQYQDAEDTYYSQFLPTAFGVSLDRAALPAIRKNAIAASCPVLLSGTPGTLIPAGKIFENENKLSYALKNAVTIGASGSVLGTVVCTTAGVAGNTPENSITFIPRPLAGLDTVVNTLSAANGKDVESDTEFRARAISLLAAGSSSSLPAILSAVREVAGVVDVSGVDNVLPYAVNGIPAGGVAITVEGGEDADIAAAIYSAVAAGQPTVGTTTVNVTTVNNNLFPISFSRVVLVPVFVDVVKTVNANYNAAVSDDVIRAQILKYIGGVSPDSVTYKGVKTGEAVYAWKAKGSLFEISNPDLLPGLVDAVVTIGFIYTSGMAEPDTVLTMTRTQRAFTDFADITVR